LLIIQIEILVMMNSTTLMYSLMPISRTSISSTFTSD
jgi:hypothetical protein